VSVITLHFAAQSSSMEVKFGESWFVRSLSAAVLMRCDAMRAAGDFELENACSREPAAKIAHLA
jgi:hypothetical protein